MILFSFEVDVLEILLHEAYDEVTHFVLVEARQAHQKQVRKPLLWPQLRLEPRFARFAAKISHVVAPRASSSSNIWHGEERSTRAGMEHIWSRRTAWQLQPWDRVISADTDEILGQPTLHRLRWCGLMHPSGVGAGLWMPMGTLDRAFAPDWTAGGYRCVLLCHRDSRPARGASVRSARTPSGRIGGSSRAAPTPRCRAGRRCSAPVYPCTPLTPRAPCARVPAPALLTTSVRPRARTRALARADAYATPTIYEWRHLAARRSRLSFGPPSDWGHRLLKPPHAAQRTTLGGIHLCAASGNLASPRLPSPPTHTAHA